MGLRYRKWIQELFSSASQIKQDSHIWTTDSVLRLWTRSCERAVRFGLSRLWCLLASGVTMSSDSWLWAQKAQDLRFHQFESARKQAESWRTGLAGLTALFGTVLAIKGSGDVTSLRTPYPQIVVILLGVAFTVLIIAVLLALQATSGAPGDEILLTGEDLQEWDSERGNEDRQTDLRRATVGRNRNYRYRNSNWRDLAWSAPRASWPVSIGGFDRHRAMWISKLESTTVT